MCRRREGGGNGTQQNGETRTEGRQRSSGGGSPPCPRGPGLRLRARGREGARRARPTYHDCGRGRGCLGGHRGLVGLVLRSFDFGLQVCRRVKIFAFLPHATPLYVIHTNGYGVVVCVDHGAVGGVRKAAVGLSPGAVSALELPADLGHGGEEHTMRQGARAPRRLPRRAPRGGEREREVHALPFFSWRLLRPLQQEFSYPESKTRSPWQTSFAFCFTLFPGVRIYIKEASKKKIYSLAAITKKKKNQQTLHWPWVLFIYRKKKGREGEKENILYYILIWNRYKTGTSTHIHVFFHHDTCALLQGFLHGGIISPEIKPQGHGCTTLRGPCKPVPPLG